LMLLAAFTPRANATLIRFYDMEGLPGPPQPPQFPVNLDSHAPASEIGAGTTLFLSNGGDMPGGTAFPAVRTSQRPGLVGINPPPGPPLPNAFSIGFTRSGQSPLGVEIPMPSSTGIYDVTSVSFAYGANGNGWSQVELQISINGGAFTTIPGTIAFLPGTPGLPVNLPVPSGTTANIPNLVLRLLFTGGQSNGVDLQNQLDNIQINGTIVPEPATIAGGLLGVLGLCWHQRRRLIRSVRFRRT
jgi:hypothetical protein